MYMNGPPEGGGDRKFRWTRMHMDPTRTVASRKYLLKYVMKVFDNFLLMSISDKNTGNSPRTLVSGAHMKALGRSGDSLDTPCCLFSIATVSPLWRRFHYILPGSNILPGFFHQIEIGIISRLDRIEIILPSYFSLGSGSTTLTHMFCKHHGQDCFMNGL